MSDAANILCLPLIAPEVAYLSALVLVPSANVLAAVDAVRRAHRIDDAVVDPPHVTLLFLGRPPGRLLLELHAALHAASTVRPRAETAGMAVFRSNGLVTNIHLRLAPNPALEQAHGMLLDARSARPPVTVDALAHEAPDREEESRFCPIGQTQPADAPGFTTRASPWRSTALPATPANAIRTMCIRSR